jgi:hypothetical protein
VGKIMSDLAACLRRAAPGAVDDVVSLIEAEPRMVRLLTIEIELGNGGKVMGGHAWIERAVSLSKLLKPGPSVPVGEG